LFKNKIKKKLSWDEKGALEGLPLYLIILVVITAIAIVIIMAWLGSIENPKVFKDPTADPQSINLIDDNADGYSSTETGTLTITVRDTSDDRISGATVTLSGCDVRFAEGGTATMQTNKSGEAAFTGLHMEVQEGSTSSITVKVQKSGYPDKQTTVPVVG
jgi:hypothetical protein